MGAENGGSIPNFNSETLSRSFRLEDSFRKSGVLGENQDDESRVRANAEVSRILNTSFSVGNVAETQVNAVLNYDSVPHMVEIVKNAGLTDRVRENAKNALYEVGLALSQNRDVFKAATEGGLGEVLVSNLDGIEPYLLSSYLTKGREDVEGQRRIEGLVDVFKSKKKVDQFPTERNKKDFQEKIGGFFDGLYEEHENCGFKEVEDGTEGRIETVMGYITKIDGSSDNPVVVETKGVDSKFAAAVEKLTQAERKTAPEENRDEPLSEEDQILADEQEAFEAIKRAEMLADKGEDSDHRTSFSYDMKYATFVNLEMYQAGVRWYAERPPEWYDNELTVEQQQIIDARCKLMNAASWKKMYRNRDLGKLIDNPDLELEGKEFGLLWEKMPGFKESLRSIVQEFAVEVVDDGCVFLRFPTEIKHDPGKGEVISVIDSVSKNVINYDRYKERLAERMAAKRLFPGLSGDEQLRRFDEAKDMFKKEFRRKNFEKDKLLYTKKHNKEIDNFEVYFDRKIELAWAKRTEINRERAAVATAANFLSISNLFESLDYYRHFTPMKNMSDKIRTAEHPYSKAVGKWGLYKKGAQMFQYKTGQTEFFAGELALWVASRMDSPIDGEEFKQRILSGELKIIPRTLGVSAIEAMPVDTAKGKMTLAKVLLNNEEIDVSKMNDAIDLFTTPMDLMKGYATIMSVLQGELKYDAGKNGSEWVTKVNSALGMMRQTEYIYRAGKGPIIPQPKTEAETRDLVETVGPIPEIDTPEFFAYLLAAGVGFDTNLRTPFLNNQSLGREIKDVNYDIAVRHLVNQITLKSTVSRRKILEILSAEKQLGMFGAKHRAELQAAREESWRKRNVK